MKKTNKLAKTLVILFSLFSLTSCNVQDFLNLKDEINQKLFPNVWAFLVQFIAFIIMVIIIIFFAYKPVKAYINKRRELLDNEVKSAKDDKDSAKELKMQAQKEIALSHKKANDIIENAKKEGEVRKEEIIEAANKEAKDKIEEANFAIEKEKNEAKKEVKNDLANVAIVLSSKILEREVSDKDNEQIINNFIDSLEKENK